MVLIVLRFVLLVGNLFFFGVVAFIIIVCLLEGRMIVVRLLECCAVPSFGSTFFWQYLLFWF